MYVKIEQFILILCFIMILSIDTISANVAPEKNEHNLSNSNTKFIQVATMKDTNLYLNEKDIYLISQVVSAESESEPYKGKVAVASVILNRLRDPQFPKTVQGVIKQKRAFSCIINGNINKIPDEDSYRAVLDALHGADPTYKAVFYYNPKIATSKWMIKFHKKNTQVIGNHVFFTD
jgi:N-acetylmuramoyl-L-alanine amidase